MQFARLASALYSGTLLKLDPLSLYSALMDAGPGPRLLCAVTDVVVHYNTAEIGDPRIYAGSCLHLHKADKADVLDDAVAKVVPKRLADLDAVADGKVGDAGRLDCTGSRPHMLLRIQ